jgi:mRNA interferase RelE/StbE
MSYTITLSKRAAKFLESLRDRALYARLRAAIDDLAHDPVPPGSKALKGSDGFRVRVGDYRILYTVEHGRLLVCVIEIGNRRDIYR